MAVSCEMRMGSLLVETFDHEAKQPSRCSGYGVHDVNKRRWSIHPFHSPPPNHMATTAIASSSAFHDLPFRWRRKIYMTTGHTISQLDPPDGAPTSAVIVTDSTTGPSTGPPTHNTLHGQENITQSNVVQATLGGTTCVFVQPGLIFRVPVVSRSCPCSAVGCYQEPEPEPSLTPASPAVDTICAINYEEVRCKLQYMQRVMEERKKVANAEQAEKENMAPPQRPLKRKRATRSPAPAGPGRAASSRGPP